MADESGSGFGGGGFGDYESLEQGSFAAPAGPFGPTMAERDETARRAAQFQAALSRYGLTPMDLMDIQSNKSLTNDILDSLSGWATTKEFARGAFGRTTLRDLMGFYSPVEKSVMDTLGKGFATFGGLPGMLGAMGIRGAAAVGTGSNADFGGGFSGPAGSMPGMDSGLGVAGANFSGPTPNPMALTPNPQSVAGAMGGQNLDQTMQELRAELDRLLAEYKMSHLFGGQA